MSCPYRPVSVARNGTAINTSHNVDIGLHVSQNVSNRVHHGPVLLFQVILPEKSQLFIKQHPAYDRRATAAIRNLIFVVFGDRITKPCSAAQ